MDKKSFANYEHKKKLKLNKTLLKSCIIYDLIFEFSFMQTLSSFLTQLVLYNLTCNLSKFGYSFSFTRHHKSNVCRIFKHGFGIIKDKWYLTKVILFKRKCCSTFYKKIQNNYKT